MKRHKPQKTAPAPILDAGPVWCLLTGPRDVELATKAPESWRCDGVNRADHVHVREATKTRLLEAGRARVLEETRRILELLPVQPQVEEEEEPASSVVVGRCVSQGV